VVPNFHGVVSSRLKEIVSGAGSASIPLLRTENESGSPILHSSSSPSSPFGNVKQNQYDSISPAHKSNSKTNSNSNSNSTSNPKPNLNTNSNSNSNTVAARDTVHFHFNLASNAQNNLNSNRINPQTPTPTPTPPQPQPAVVSIGSGGHRSSLSNPLTALPYRSPPSPSDTVFPNHPFHTAPDSFNHLQRLKQFRTYSDNHQSPNQTQRRPKLSYEEESKTTIMKGTLPLREKPKLTSTSSMRNLHHKRVRGRIGNASYSSQELQPMVHHYLPMASSISLANVKEENTNPIRDDTKTSISINTSPLLTAGVNGVTNSISQTQPSPQQQPPSQSQAQAQERDVSENDGVRGRDRSRVTISLNNKEVDGDVDADGDGFELTSKRRTISVSQSATRSVFQQQLQQFKTLQITKSTLSIEPVSPSSPSSASSSTNHSSTLTVPLASPTLASSQTSSSSSSSASDSSSSSSIPLPLTTRFPDSDSLPRFPTSDIVLHSSNEWKILPIPFVDEPPPSSDDEEDTETESSKKSKTIQEKPTSQSQQSQSQQQQQSQQPPHQSKKKMKKLDFRREEKEEKKEEEEDEIEESNHNNNKNMKKKDGIEDGHHHHHHHHNELEVEVVLPIPNTPLARARQLFSRTLAPPPSVVARTRKLSQLMSSSSAPDGLSSARSPSPSSTLTRLISPTSIRVDAASEHPHGSDTTHGMESGTVGLSPPVGTVSRSQSGAISRSPSQRHRTPASTPLIRAHTTAAPIPESLANSIEQQWKQRYLQQVMGASVPEGELIRGASAGLAATSLLRSASRITHRTQTGAPPSALSMMAESSHGLGNGTSNSPNSHTSTDGNESHRRKSGGTGSTPKTGESDDDVRIDIKKGGHHVGGGMDSPLSRSASNTIGGISHGGMSGSKSSKSALAKASGIRDAESAFRLQQAETRKRITLRFWRISLLLILVYLSAGLANLIIHNYQVAAPLFAVCLIHIVLHPLICSNKRIFNEQFLSLPLLRLCINATVALAVFCIVLGSFYNQGVTSVAVWYLCFIPCFVSYLLYDLNRLDNYTWTAISIVCLFAIHLTSYLQNGDAYYFTGVARCGLIVLTQAFTQASRSTIEQLIAEREKRMEWSVQQGKQLVIARNQAINAGQAKSQFLAVRYKTKNKKTKKQKQKNKKSYFFLFNTIYFSLDEKQFGFTEFGFALIIQ